MKQLSGKAMIVRLRLKRIDNIGCNRCGIGGFLGAIRLIG